MEQSTLNIEDLAMQELVNRPGFITSNCAMYDIPVSSNILASSSFKSMVFHWRHIWKFVWSSLEVTSCHTFTLSIVTMFLVEGVAYALCTAKLLVVERKQKSYTSLFGEHIADEMMKVIHDISIPKDSFLRRIDNLYLEN